MAGTINFFCEDFEYKLGKPRKTSKWLKGIISSNNRELSTVNFIFCSDEYLYKINQDYLKHTTYTDIITFDNSEGVQIEGDIYISIERVKDNAKRLGKSFGEELHRVLVHGILHLLGHKDKSAQEQARMRAKEDECLSLPDVPRETF
jgi:probable rRNA maturation factor